MPKLKADVMTYGLTFDTWLGSTIRSTCSLCGPTSLQKSTPATQLNSKRLHRWQDRFFERINMSAQRFHLLASGKTYFGQALGGLTVQNRNPAEIVAPRKQSWKSTIVKFCKQTSLRLRLTLCSNMSASHMF